MFHVREILNAFLARISNDEEIEEANRTDLEGYVDETSYIYIGQSGEVLVSAERYAAGEILPSIKFYEPKISSLLGYCFIRVLAAYGCFSSAITGGSLDIEEQRRRMREKRISFVITAITREATYSSLFFRRNSGEPFNAGEQDRH